MNVHRNTSDDGSYVKRFAVLVAAWSIVGTMPVRCDAVVFYDFVEASATSPVLATLKLVSLPATHEEVVRLAFTPEGMTRFGLTLLIGSDFDYISGTALSSVVDDGMGRLEPGPFNFGSVTIDDEDPILVPITFPDQELTHFQMRFGRGNPASDRLQGTYFCDGCPGLIPQIAAVGESIDNKRTR